MGEGDFQVKRYGFYLIFLALITFKALCPGREGVVRAENKHTDSNDIVSRHGYGNTVILEEMAYYHKKWEEMNKKTLEAYNRGDYREGTRLAKNALRYATQYLGLKDPDTLSSMNNLAGLYYSQGRYRDAEPLFKKALQLREEILGINNPDTLSSMNNLAELYYSQGRYSEAEPLFKKALQLREEVLGDKNPDTLQSMYNLARLYHSQGRYSEAESLYKKVLKLNEEASIEKDTTTLSILNNLACLYNSQRRYGEAEVFYKKAFDLSEEIAGINHQMTLNILLNYSVCLINLKEEKRALSMLQILERRLLSYKGLLLSDNSKEPGQKEFPFLISSFQDIVFSFSRFYKTSESIQFASNVIFRWKQMRDDEDAYIERLIQRSFDNRIKLAGTKIKKLRTNAAREYYSPMKGKRSEEIFNILKRLESAELELAKISNEYKRRLEIFKADAEQVKSELTQDSVLIEFRLYNSVDFETTDSGKQRLAAALLLSGKALESLFFEDLGETEQTMKLWSLMLQSDDGKKADELAKELYQNLFSRFESHIKNIKKIYIATDGFLSLIPYPRLILPDGRYWIERQNICLLQTGRDLIQSDFEPVISPLLALGGVNFDQYSEQKHAIRTIGALKASNKATADKIGSFRPLAFSKEEAEEIGTIYRISSKREPMILQGMEASEAALKTFKTPPGILHLSTCGFYLDSKEQERHPFMLSGIALAGANRGLQDKTASYAEDGILYSFEVLSLDLKGTELVSLSACCYPVKEIADCSKGINRLAKAFKIAGADSVLLPLPMLPVEDEERKEFIVRFYESWLQEGINNPSEALRKTQLNFINHQYQDLRDPRVWASYVLVGGKERLIHALR